MLRLLKEADSSTREEIIKLINLTKPSLKTNIPKPKGNYPTINKNSATKVWFLLTESSGHAVYKSETNFVRGLIAHCEKKGFDENPVFTYYMGGDPAELEKVIGKNALSFLKISFSRLIPDLISDSKERGRDIAYALIIKILSDSIGSEISEEEFQRSVQFIGILRDTLFKDAYANRNAILGDRHGRKEILDTLSALAHSFIKGELNTETLNHELKSFYNSESSLVSLKKVFSDIISEFRGKNKGLPVLTPTFTFFDLRNRIKAADLSAEKERVKTNREVEEGLERPKDITFGNKSTFGDASTLQEERVKLLDVLNGPKAKLIRLLETRQSSFTARVTLAGSFAGLGFLTGIPFLSGISLLVFAYFYWTEGKREFKVVSNREEENLLGSQDGALMRELETEAPASVFNTLAPAVGAVAEESAGTSSVAPVTGREEILMGFFERIRNPLKSRVYRRAFQKAYGGRTRPAFSFARRWTLALGLFAAQPNAFADVPFPTDLTTAVAHMHFMGEAFNSDVFRQTVMDVEAVNRSRIGGGVYKAFVAGTDEERRDMVRIIKEMKSSHVVVLPVLTTDKTENVVSGISAYLAGFHGAAVNPTFSREQDAAVSAGLQDLLKKNWGVLLLPVVSLLSLDKMLRALAAVAEYA